MALADVVGDNGGIIYLRGDEEVCPNTIEQVHRLGVE